MIVPNQSNIKIHLATTESISSGIAAIAGESKYNLGTAFPFVYTMFKTGKNKSKNIINRISEESNHYILDSGLFTLMFGALKGKKDSSYIDKWYECLTDFVLDEKYYGTMVEVDCQKVLGPDKAWDYRIKMKNKVKNRIINVFHIEDGQKGLDKLIEFSDYIAVSVPELRFCGKKKYLNEIVYYIKNKKPDIDIHLLGCTEKSKLKELNFCSSADSSSWISGIKYGLIETSNGKGHIKNLNKDLIIENYSKWFNIRNKIFPEFNLPKNVNNLGILTFASNQYLKIYSSYAGNQD